MEHYRSMSITFQFYKMKRFIEKLTVMIVQDYEHYNTTKLYK